MFKDEYKGRGGAYIFDPKTGKRRRDDARRRPDDASFAGNAGQPAETANKPKGGTKQ